MPRLGDPRHRERRQVLRVVGPLVLLAGLVLTAVGIVSFFSSFGSFGPPKYFWCAFLGMPLMAFGAAITKFAYLGSIARYLAEETTPVGVDTFNTMAHGTKDAMRDVASAVGQGIHAGFTGQTTEEPVRCRACGVDNASDARFCSGCGGKLDIEIVCNNCGEACEPDARFCDQCGTALTPT